MRTNDWNFLLLSSISALLGNNNKEGGFSIKMHFRQAKKFDFLTRNGMKNKNASEIAGQIASTSLFLSTLLSRMRIVVAEGVNLSSLRYPKKERIWSQSRVETNFPFSQQISCGCRSRHELSRGKSLHYLSIFHSLWEVNFFFPEHLYPGLNDSVSISVCPSLGLCGV